MSQSRDAYRWRRDLHEIEAGVKAYRTLREKLLSQTTAADFPDDDRDHVARFLDH